jgi:hypothetical protein
MGVSEGGGMKKELAIVAVVAVVVGGIVLSAWKQSDTISIPTNNLVPNGVAVVVVCGEKNLTESFIQSQTVAPGGRVGTWSPEKEGDCVIWYHHPQGS